MVDNYFIVTSYTLVHRIKSTRMHHNNRSPDFHVLYNIKMLLNLQQTFKDTSGMVTKGTNHKLCESIMHIWSNRWKVGEARGNEWATNQRGKGTLVFSEKKIHIWRQEGCICLCRLQNQLWTATLISKCKTSWTWQRALHLAFTLSSNTTFILFSGAIYT